MDVTVIILLGCCLIAMTDKFNLCPPMLWYT